MSESLQVIADKREYRTDLILVQQVRLQLLAEQISLPTAYDEGMGTRITHVPSAGYAYALHDKLEQIRHDSSFHVSSQHDGQYLLRDLVSSANTLHRCYRRILLQHRAHDQRNDASSRRLGR